MYDFAAIDAFSRGSKASGQERPPIGGNAFRAAASFSRRHANAQPAKARRNRAFRWPHSGIRAIA